jgi:hypothetical protein
LESELPSWAFYSELEQKFYFSEMSAYGTLDATISATDASNTYTYSAMFTFDFDSDELNKKPYISQAMKKDKMHLCRVNEACSIAFEF